MVGNGIKNNGKKKHLKFINFLHTESILYIREISYELKSGEDY